MVNCLQYAHQMLAEGKLPLKKELIKERVTYHDPCNIARSGRITEEPRELLRAICKDFVEMTPNRTENYCCGGGGGTVSIDERLENEGVRSLILAGVSEPSLRMYMPKCPRADSTAK